MSSFDFWYLYKCQLNYILLIHQFADIYKLACLLGHVYFPGVWKLSGLSKLIVVLCIFVYFN